MKRILLALLLQDIWFYQRIIFMSHVLLYSSIYKAGSVSEEFEDKNANFSCIMSNIGAVCCLCEW